MVDLAQLVQFAANGMVVGSVLTLAAVGLTLVYGILHLANFAHGDLVTLGAYLGLFFTSLIPGSEAILWAFGAAAVLMTGIGLDRFVRPRIREDSEPVLSTTEIVLSVVATAVLVSIVAGMELDLGLSDGVIPAAAAATASAGILWTARDAVRNRRRAAQVAAAGAVLVAVLYGVVAPVLLAGPGMPWGWTAALALVPVACLGFTVDRSVLGGWPARAGLAGAVVLLLGAFGSRFLLGVVLAILMAMALTVLLDLTIWRFMRSREAGLVTLLIASIGLALALRHSIILRWGSEIRTFPGPVTQATSVLGTTIRLTDAEVAVVLISVAAILVVHVLLRYTRIGKAMRALSDNEELARITGIDVDRVILYVWLIAGGLAALAGILLGNLRSFTPDLGWLLLLPIFAAVILGGIGSPYGAIAGGMTIGVAMEISPAFGVPTAYKSAVGFVILIAVLLVRPQGIFGGQATR